MGYIKQGGVQGHRWERRINGDGQTVMSALALVATTAKVPMAITQTDSGPGILMVASSGTLKIGFPLDAVSSGEYVDVVVGGPCSGMYTFASAGTAANATAHSTFTKGDMVFWTDTGHITQGGATWETTMSHQTTLVGSESGAAMGICLSSGETATLDFFLVEKDCLPECTS